MGGFLPQDLILLSRITVGQRILEKIKFEVRHVFFLS